MRKTFFILILGLTILIQGCKKESAPEQFRQTIDVALKVNQVYELDLGSYGREEGADISKQAKHFVTSTATRTGSNMTYKYIPAANYVGTDEVELKSEKGSNGAHLNPNISFINIKFTISN
jgi:hypothetical protein